MLLMRPSFELGAENEDEDEVMNCATELCFFTVAHYDTLLFSISFARRALKSPRPSVHFGYTGTLI